jgi:beta-glucosidase-like glycosyl hydrolase
VSEDIELAFLSFAALTSRHKPEPITGADYQNPGLPVEKRVEDLLGRMTLDEKLSMMATPKTILDVALGMRSLFKTSENKRLGIPPFCVYTTGGSRGANSMATAFPVAMARGASWDRELEHRVHSAIALEAAGFGMNLMLSPVLNIVRHPGMGRAQETYGEDTFHMGEMGVSAITGIQNHVIAQVKHYALNSEQHRARPLPHRCPAGRADAAGGLPAALQEGGAESQRGLGDDLLQQGERGLCQRE